MSSENTLEATELITESFVQGIAVKDRGCYRVDGTEFLIDMEKDGPKRGQWVVFTEDGNGELTDYAHVIYCVELLDVIETLSPKAKPEVDFSCGVCGKQCDLAPDPPERAVCEECCEDHEYEYDRGERHHLCKHCGKRVDPDWYRCDDDVI